MRYITLAMLVLTQSYTHIHTHSTLYTNLSGQSPFAAAITTNFQCRHNASSELRVSMINQNLKLKCIVPS